LIVNNLIKTRILPEKTKAL